MRREGGEGVQGGRRTWYSDPRAERIMIPKSEMTTLGERSGQRWRYPMLDSCIARVVNIP